MVEVNTLSQLIQLRPGDFRDIDLTQEDILHWLTLAEAGWMHNGDPRMPHAELASGMCSNGFFFCRKLLRFPNVNEILAHQLARKLIADCCLTGGVGAVVGSPYSSITLAGEMAKEFFAIHGIPEKDPKDPNGKKMVWKEELPAGTRVLRVEELITTTGSTLETTLAIQATNPWPVTFLPVIGALVHRPPTLPVDYWGMRIVPLVQIKVWAVPPEKCELCRQGSVRVKPKSNWALLTAGKKK